MYMTTSEYLHVCTCYHGAVCDENDEEDEADATRDLESTRIYIQYPQFMTPHVDEP